MNIVTIAVSFLLGVLVFQTSSHLPPKSCLILIPTAIILMRIWPRSGPLCVSILAYCWAYIFAIGMLFPQLSESLQNKDISISGRVVELNIQNKQYSQFIYEVQMIMSFENFKINIPHRIKLSWYYPPELIHIGQSCHFTVRLKKHWRFANPGSFDSEKSMFLRGTGGRGYVKNGQCLTSDTSKVDSNSLRDGWLEKFSEYASKFESYRLMSALSFGYRENIDNHDWQVLRNTGTSHLLAISGLHISAISAFVYLITIRLARCSAWICEKWTAQKTAAIFALIAAIFYAYLAGFSLPTQRALIMVMVGLWAILLNKPIVNYSVLSVALLLVLISNPMATLTAGFWMSFLAVFFIFVFLKCAHFKNKLMKIIFLQFYLGAALFPISLLFFAQASVIAPLVNIIAIPVVSFFILPVLLMSVVLSLLDVNIAMNMLLLVDQMFEWLWWGLEATAKVEFASYEYYPTLFAVIACCMGLVILVHPIGLPAKYLAFILLSSLFFIQPSKIDSQQLQMTVLDVGQGLSVVIETANYSLVYDAGPRFRSGFGTGHAVVLPFLHYRGIHQVDLAVVSHNDNDHAGGMHALLDHNKARAVLVSNEAHLYESKNIQLCRAGDHWIWDGVLFEILHPPENWHSSDNDRSCVIKISHPAGSILLTGDIETTAENWLVEQYGDNLGSDLLLVPHHGSTSSSSYRFVGRVHPQTSVFSAGYMNRYGFPHATIMQRYQELGAQLVDITREGAVTFLFDAEKGIITQPGYRKKTKRYWHSTKE